LSDPCAAEIPGPSIQPSNHEGNMILRFGKTFVAAAAFGVAALASLPAGATFFGSRDGAGIGIGAACASLMTSIARQPAAEPTITPIYREAADTILSGRYGAVKDVPQGIGAYKAAQIEGIARNPNTEPLLIARAADCAADLGALGSTRPDRAAVAIGAMCAAALTGIARQPEAEAKILAAYTDGVELIAALQPRSSAHVRAEGYGLVSAAQIEGMARQPGASDKLAGAAATCRDDILRY
jgi:F0F1-type ATP synthase membrane subunit c/vacuolar-type H+-ATPase subunit K